MASFFDTLFGGGAEREAADRNRQALATYQTQGLGALDKAYGASSGYLTDAGNLYSGLSDKYGKATSLGLDALGVNGADGNARATAAFQAGPGYQFTLDSGLDALNRRRAGAGMADSGNADVDAIKFGTGLADQTYGSWLDRLGGYISPELQATQGKASSLGALSDLSQNDATNRIGLFGNVASGNIGANNLEAQGASQGARNALGGALSLATLGTSLAGGGGLGSSLFKSAASGRSGTYNPSTMGFIGV